MAFVLSSKRRFFSRRFDDGVMLEFRYFEGSERDKLQKELAKIRGTKKFTDKFNVLMSQVAQALLVRWEGILDEEGKVVEPTDENKKAFFTDAEANKYWERPLMAYLYPTEESAESDSALPEEAAEDPDFLSGK
jgi:hypothetical protein